MPEITEDDVTRLAEAIHRAAFTVGSSQANDIARRLLEQGVTLPPPPPDPAVVVAEALIDKFRDEWGGCNGGVAGALIPAVRDLFPPEALAAAAAKVQDTHGKGVMGAGENGWQNTAKVQEADQRPKIPIGYFSDEATDD